MNNKQLSKINKKPLFQINYSDGEIEFMICSKSEFKVEKNRLKNLGVKFQWKMFPSNPNLD